MIVYHLLYSLLLLLAVVDMIKPLRNKTVDVITNFLIIAFTLFRGLRWETGTDWTPYLDTYMSSSFANIFSFDRGGMTGELMEPGYVLINALFNSLFPYTIFLLATNAFILWAHKYTINYFFQKRRLFVFCFMIISVAFFPVRIDLANALLILSLPFLVKKDYKWYLLISLAAFSIHKSSIFVMILIFAVSRFKFSIPVLITIFISSFIMGITVIQSFGDAIAPLVLQLDPTYESSLDLYFNRVDDEASRGVMAILNAIILIGIGLIVGWKNESLRNNKDFNLFLTLMTIYISINLMLVAAGLTWLSRAIKYLYFTDAFTLAYIANAITLPKLKARGVTKIPIIFMTLLILVLSVNRYVNKCNFYPHLMFPYISVMEPHHRMGLE